MIDKLLTEHHSPESTLVKMSHCWKSHNAAQIHFCSVFIDSDGPDLPCADE